MTYQTPNNAPIMSPRSLYQLLGKPEWKFEVWGKLSDRNCENKYIENFGRKRAPGRLDFVNGMFLDFISDVCRASYPTGPEEARENLVQI